MERAIVSPPAAQTNKSLPATEERVDYCPYCGAELVGSFSFCPDCGTQIAKEPPKQQASIKNIQPQETTSPAKDEGSVGYYFENMTEFALYIKFFSKGKQVQWLSGDNYLVAQRKGYDLVEKRQYQQAIEALKQSLKLNPIGLGARFEMCEAYIQMRDLSMARATLFEMKDFLIEAKYIAKFYRRLGFIEIENRNFSVAAACYQYSRRFEDHVSIPNELAYIRQAAGRNVETSNPEKVLSNAGIPLLTASNIS